MVKEDRRHYWIINVEDYDIDLEEFSMEELQDTVVEGLQDNIKYISVINKYGENIFHMEGHHTENLEDEAWIEILDEEGNMDIEKTAKVIAEDFVANKAIIAMRFESDMYDELGKDTDWLDKILEGD